MGQYFGGRAVRPPASPARHRRKALTRHVKDPRAFKGTRRYGRASRSGSRNFRRARSEASVSLR
jgi:hypothetical protein